MLLDKKIGQGMTAEIFDIGNNRVVKLFYKTIPQYLIEHEYNINKMLFQEGFPVANVYDFIEYEGRKGIIYEKIEGEPLLQRIVKKPWTVRRAGRIMADIHLKIHRNTDCNLQSIKENLNERILHVNQLDNDIKKLLSEFIRCLPDSEVLCHGDFHPDNIILSKEKVFVIDWMTATKGDPLADVSRTALILKIADLPKETPSIIKVLMKFLRNQMRSAYLKRYIQKANCSVSDIQQWEVPVAAARLIEKLSISEKESIVGLIRENQRYIKKVVASNLK